MHHTYPFLFKRSFVRLLEFCRSWAICGGRGRGRWLEAEMCAPRLAPTTNLYVCSFIPILLLFVNLCNVWLAHVAACHSPEKTLQGCLWDVGWESEVSMCSPCAVGDILPACPAKTPVYQLLMSISLLIPGIYFRKKGFVACSSWNRETAMSEAKLSRDFHLLHNQFWTEILSEAWQGPYAG